MQYQQCCIYMYFYYIYLVHNLCKCRKALPWHFLAGCRRSFKRQACFEIWIVTHSSKAHQYFWLVLNRETLTTINISRRMDISWDGALHLFTSSLTWSKQANPSVCTGTWTQVPHLNTSSWPDDVIIPSVFALCLLGFAFHWTSEWPLWTATKHRSRGCHWAQPPAGSRAITNTRAEPQVQLLSQSPPGSFGIKPTAISKLQPCLDWWPLQGPPESLQSWQWSANTSSEENSVEWRSSATLKVGTWQCYEFLQTVKTIRFQALKWGEKLMIWANQS